MLGVRRNGVDRRSLRARVGFILICLGLLSWGSPGSAHPHVWIDASVEVLFENNRVVGYRIAWTFDELISAAMLEDFDTDGDGTISAVEAPEVVTQIFEPYAEINHMTLLRVDGAETAFARVADASASAADGRLSIIFTAALATPLDPRSHALALGVFDPEYFVEILLDGLEPVRFAGDWPADCIPQIREDIENPIYFGLVAPPTVMVKCGGA